MTIPPALRQDTTYSIVIPSIGRASLTTLLTQLALGEGPGPDSVVVIDDRPFGPRTAAPLELGPAPWPLQVIRTGGRGPAAARNAGWRAVRTPWVAFLDDDVEVGANWMTDLNEDLSEVATQVGGIEARIVVPLPAGRRPTDWERNTAGLQDAAWITADMAYRRSALQAVHGFDERFPRAFREDADLALRVQAAGWRLVRGNRTTVHPVRPTDDWVSVRVQAGAADDVLMRNLHGRRWRERAQAGPPGRFRWHLVAVGSFAASVVSALARRPGLAVAFAACWWATTVDFLLRRLMPGPRPGDSAFRSEARRMVVTSMAIPFAAVRHRIGGYRRFGRTAPAWPVPVRAVLFDRDGTLVHDEPYNGDPAKVRAVDGARELLNDLRTRGVKVGVISNQSGIGRGLVTSAQVAAVNDRIERELGPFDVWQICPHVDADRCMCRKPLPGMVLRAAELLGVPPYQCALIGDIGADVRAANAAGAVGVLVPTAVTRHDEIDAAELVAADLKSAVELVVPPTGPKAGVTPAGTRDQMDGAAA
jgi:HAD superfamily hydrolase (TIGR01662 family)